MSRFQVDQGERIPIYEFEPGSQNGTPPNVIYIRPRMNVGQANLVMAMAATRDAAGNAVADEQAAEYLTAQMVVNIVAWEGPDFDELPCTPETIRKLPGNDEFIQRVSHEITVRNRGRQSPDQKKVTASGSSSAGLKPSIALRSAELASASTTTRSRSPSGAVGRQKK